MSSVLEQRDEHLVGGGADVLTLYEALPVRILRRGRPLFHGVRRGDEEPAKAHVAKLKDQVVGEDLVQEGSGLHFEAIWGRALLRLVLRTRERSPKQIQRRLQQISGVDFRRRELLDDLGKAGGKVRPREKG
eukprot:scaffold3970_cov257-Pinguiococcus_pyrenoidosus.AAC.10